MTTMSSVRIVDRDGKVGLDHLQLADLAIEHALADVDDRRDEPGPHRLHQEPIVATSGFDHLPSLGGIDGERLLAQHVLARIEGSDRHRVVMTVRRRDVDDVDVVIGPQRVVTAVRTRNPEALGEVVGRLLGPRADSGDVRSRQGP